MLAVARRNRTRSTSVARHLREGSVHNFYEAHGGLGGTFGVPLGPIAMSGSTGLASYSGGRIRLTADGPEGERITVVRVRYVGFHCIEESDWDQGTGSDEPYFIIGVAATNGSRTTRFDYEEINTGSKRFAADDIVPVGAELKPPIVIGVFAVEHDEGSRKEAEGKVRSVIETAEKALDQAGKAIAAIYGLPVTNHVMPDWMRDIVVGWAPEAAAAIFGLADDEIGKKPRVLFDSGPDLLEWKAPAVIGRHGDNDYNVAINVDGGDEGNYDVFFLVDLLDITKEWRDRQ
jgi:hypothetical protein